VLAEIRDLKGMSGHADAAELVRWLSAINTPPRTVFVTHGEEDAALALAARIERERRFRPRAQPGRIRRAAGRGGSLMAEADSLHARRGFAATIPRFPRRGCPRRTAVILHERTQTLRTPEEVDGFLARHPRAVLLKLGTCHKNTLALHEVEKQLGAERGAATGSHPCRRVAARQQPRGNSYGDHSRIAAAHPVPGRPGRLRAQQLGHHGRAVREGLAQLRSEAEAMSVSASSAR